MAQTPHSLHLNEMHLEGEIEPRTPHLTEQQVEHHPEPRRAPNHRIANETPLKSEIEPERQTP